MKTVDDRRGGFRDEPLATGGEKSPYNEKGIDVTLIDWMLSLSPEERIQVLQEAVLSLIDLRGEQTQT